MNSTNSLVTFLHLFIRGETINHEQLKVFTKGIEERLLYCNNSGRIYSEKYSGLLGV